ncbi:hypothetical protein SK3146_03164 [Paenibacillus konkukensis]|uniref:Glycosyltransferase RgtA/B/C/D-like domain-containing protein n=1 Tax=Paenibacillus konkukensis TaxID=2020716 RepID=A0ABY4RNB1_9BACL|nr:hypothetical protein [Paenibacillus konkukensis]UQZ83952.1 hypothetical protein SK3146_03164 [Paenibacillus konkukensis]
MIYIRNTINNNIVIIKLILIFITSRIFLTFIGVVSNYYLKSIHEFKKLTDNSNFIALWGQWDSAWYLKIAQNWYKFDPSFNPYANHQDNYAFFPFYPLLIKLVNLIINDYFISGLLISNFSAIVSLALLYKIIVNENYGNNIAYSSVKLLIYFPTSFLLSALLTESLYLSITLLCFYYAKKQKWFLVGIFGLLLALTRNIGVFIIFPMLFEYLRSKDYKIINISYNVIFLLFIPVGTILWGLYNYYLTRDFLAFVHIQSAWARSFANPLNYLFYGFFAKDPYHFILSSATLFSVILLIISIRKINFSYILLGFYSIFIPLCTGLDSMARYTLVIFPIYLILSLYSRKPFVENNLKMVFLLLQGFFMVFWSHGFPLII